MTPADRRDPLQEALELLVELVGTGRPAFPRTPYRAAIDKAKAFIIAQSDALRAAPRATEPLKCYGTVHYWSDQTGRCNCGRMANTPTGIAAMPSATRAEPPDQHEIWCATGRSINSGPKCDCDGR